MSYTNRQKVEQYLGAGVSLADIDSQVTLWISAVENIINTYIGYAFASDNGTKYYDIPKTNTLFTDRFTGTPEITIYNHDGSVFKTLVEGVGNDYVAQPYNEGYFDRIVFLKNPYYFDYIIDDDEDWIGEKRIAVTADFGSGATIPEDIELVATMLVATIAEKRLKGGNPKSESLGDYSISYRDIEQTDSFTNVKVILDSYRDIAI